MNQAIRSSFCASLSKKFASIGMKFALAARADQSWGFLVSDGGSTTGAALDRPQGEYFRRLLGEKAGRPGISVIIPVYNSAPYLKRCLEAVAGQSLGNIEIICVNDASADDSLAILREYESKDARIKVIDFSENKGAAEAKNAALAVARGEYLGFVDSDDQVDLDFYEKLYAKAAETGAAIVKGELLEITENGSVKHDSINERIRNDKFKFNRQFTSAIYKTELIRRWAVDFPSGVTHGEDLAFLMKVVCLAPGVEVVDGAFYRYHRRAGSANAKLFSRAKIMSVWRAIGHILVFIKRPEIEPRAYVFFLLRVWQSLPGRLWHRAVRGLGL